MNANEVQVTELLKALLLKDLRIQCRMRGLNPGGSRDALLQRVKEHMLETGNWTLASEFNGEAVLSMAPAPTVAGDEEAASGGKNNNYTRPDGQNCGNFITDKPSSRVLAPPGGKPSFSFDDGSAPVPPLIPARHSSGVTASVDVKSAPAAAPAAQVDIFGQSSGASSNNYTRPQGQNTGNFLTDKPSSRVLAPPGGGSHIVFG